MSDQPAFDFERRHDWPEVSLEGFAAHHAANPQVYAKLREFALEAKRAGRTRMGINMLHERVRWYTTVESKGEPWKLNNNYRPFYARLLMAQEPELVDFFETRTAAADDRPH